MFHGKKMHMQNWQNCLMVQLQ